MSKFWCQKLSRENLKILNILAYRGYAIFTTLLIGQLHRKLLLTLHLTFRHMFLMCHPLYRHMPHREFQMYLHKHQVFWRFRVFMNFLWNFFMNLFYEPFLCTFYGHLYELFIHFFINFWWPVLWTFYVRFYELFYELFMHFFYELFMTGFMNFLWPFLRTFYGRFYELFYDLFMNFFTNFSIELFRNNNFLDAVDSIASFSPYRYHNSIGTFHQYYIYNVKRFDTHKRPKRANKKSTWRKVWKTDAGRDSGRRENGRWKNGIRVRNWPVRYDVTVRNWLDHCVEKGRQNGIKNKFVLD